MAKVVRIGDSVSASRKITQEDVTAFGTLINDFNPIHMDAEAAQKAGFATPICHGMFAGSLFSGLIGMQLPGPGSVYLNQTLQFSAPVFVGDEVTATVTVKEFKKTSGLILLTCVVSKTDSASGNNVICVTGEALGMNKTVTYEGESEWTYVRPKN